MQRVLLIYDTTGYIISQMSGDVREPQGVPFLWVDVPNGKMVTGIDVAQTPNVAIFEDYPKSETELLKEKVDALTLAYAEMMGV
jgi:hypothetical protein